VHRRQICCTFAARLSIPMRRHRRRARIRPGRAGGLR
jgi:hypothetical protein